MFVTKTYVSWVNCGWMSGIIAKCPHTCHVEFLKKKTKSAFNNKKKMLRNLDKEMGINEPVSCWLAHAFKLPLPCKISEANKK